MKIDTPTVKLNNSKKYYRKLDNDTLRAKIPGEESVTAKDIWLDALTCNEDWLFTTKNIADRWGISIKRANNKLALLSKSGYAEPNKIVDPKDGKIMIHYWVFYESPHAQKRACGKNDVSCCNDRPKPSKAHMPENGDVEPIKNKHKEAASFSRPKIALPEEVKTELEGSGIDPAAAMKCQENFDDTEYTVEAIKYAKTKDSPSAYFKVLASKKCSSVTNRIRSRRKEAEKLDKDRDHIRIAIAQQEEAKTMAQMVITDFAEGARRMREALRR